MKTDNFESELLQLGRMLESSNGNAATSEMDLDSVRDEFCSRIRDLSLGIRGKGMRPGSVELLTRSTSRLPADCRAILDLEPGSTFADAILAARALHVLVQCGDDLIKQRGDYFIRNRREGRVSRVDLFRLGRELGLQGARV